MIHSLISFLKSPDTIYWSFGIFLFITGNMIYHNSKAKSKFIALFHNKFFMISAIISISFSKYILNLPDNSDETNRLKTATNQAIIAFLVAMFAYLDIKITPFWLIWLISYHFYNDS